MEFLTNHEQVFQLILHYKYAVIVPVTVLEGPLVMLISGFLIKLGYLAILPAYLCLMLGDIIGDVFWYMIGYYWGEPFIKRFGKYVSIDEKSVAIVKKVFHSHDTPILVISKLTMGFGFAIVTLFTAGLVKIPFRKYFILNLTGQLIWTGLLMYAGFALGKFYLTINSIIGKTAMIALFIAIFFALIGFGKYMRTRITKKHLI